MAGLSGFFKRLDGLYETSSDEILEEEEIEEEIEEEAEEETEEEVEEEFEEEVEEVEDEPKRPSKVGALREHYRGELDSLTEFNKTRNDSEMRRYLNLGYQIVNVDGFGVDEIELISSTFEKLEKRKKEIVEKEEMADWLDCENKARAAKRAAATVDDGGTKKLLLEDVKPSQPIVVRKPQGLQPPKEQLDEVPAVEQVSQPDPVPQPVVAQASQPVQASQPTEAQTPQPVQAPKVEKPKKKQKPKVKNSDELRLEMIQLLSSSKPDGVKLTSLLLKYLGLCGTPEKLIEELLAGDTCKFFELASEYARECGKLSFGVMEATSFSDLVIVPVNCDDERQEGFWVDQKLLTGVAIDPRTGRSVRFGTLYPEQYKQLTKRDPLDMDKRDIILVTIDNGIITGETSLWDYVTAGASKNS